MANQIDITMPIFSGLQMAAPLSRVKFSMRGYLGGLPGLW